MADAWIDVPIFISSTFNDMHGERDYLVKNVFPELYEWCQVRQLRLIDIDLRWGVTRWDSQAKNTVKKCLQSIDDCRPFFLCFLGQRRGWVPQEDEISLETYGEYPETKQLAGETSVTEMEIEHALLAPMLKMVEEQPLRPQPNEHVLFFFRENPFPDTLDEAHRRLFTNEGVRAEGGDPIEASRKLETLKEKVRREHGVTDYHCQWNPEAATPELKAEPEGEILAQGRLENFYVEEAGLSSVVRLKLQQEFPEAPVDKVPLKYVLLAQLMLEILAAYPEREAAAGEREENSFAADAKEQEIFARTACEGCLPIDYALGWLNGYIRSEAPWAFWLAGASGAGKTTVLAEWLTDSDFSGKKVYFRFCGATDLALDVLSVWRSICYEGGIQEPKSLADLQKKFPLYLAQLGQKGETVIIIDGADELKDGLNMLGWLTQYPLPQGVKLVITVNETGTAKRMIAGGEAHGMAVVRRLLPLSDKEEKQALIDTYLKKSLKALDDEHLEAICGVKESENPLFLKILLAELRVFGSFKQLRAAIDSYGDSPAAAFTRMLLRLEEEQPYGVIEPKKAVPFLFGLLSAARSGLTENELIWCFLEEFPEVSIDEIEGTIRYFLRQVRPFVRRYKDRSDFGYESFKRAAAALYKPINIRLHQRLTDCFYLSCDSLGDGSFVSEDRRSLLEAAYHLYEGHGSTEIYRSVAYLDARCSLGAFPELLAELEERCEGDSFAAELLPLLFRYQQFLGEHPHSLAAVLHYSGADELKAGLLQARENGTLRSSWLEVTALREMPSAAEASATCRTLGERAIGFTAGIALAKEADLAFLVAEAGTIQVLNTLTLTPYATYISVSDKPLLSLAVSANGEYVVAAFEDGRAEIMQVKVIEGQVLATKIGEVSYHLPYSGAGMFAFEKNRYLWFQQSDFNLVRWALEDGVAAGKVQAEEEVTSLAAAEDRLIFSVWKEQGCSLYGYPFQAFQRMAVRNFQEDDVLFFECTEEGFFAASMHKKTSGYGVYYLDKNLEVLRVIHLPEPAAAMLKLAGDVLFILPQYKPDSCFYLWEFKTEEGFSRCVFPGFPFLTQVCLASNSEGDLVFAGNDRVVCFDLAEGRSEELILEMKLQAGELALWRLDLRGKPVFYKGTQGIRPTEELAQRFLPLLSEDGSVLLGDSGAGWRLVGEGAFQPFELGSWPLSAVLTEAGLYYFEGEGFLRSEAGVSVDLRRYQLSVVNLYTGGDLLVVTGVCGDQQAVVERCPYVVFFYQILAGGRLKELGCRRFSIELEPIEEVCVNQESGELYIFFKKSGTSLGVPYVVYGTAEEIIEGRESDGYLNVPMKGFSAAVLGGYLLVCTEGMLSCHDSVSLAYQTAFKAPAEIRWVRGDSGGVLLAIGDNIAARVKVVKG